MKRRILVGLLSIVAVLAATSAVAQAQTFSTTTAINAPNPQLAGPTSISATVTRSGGGNVGSNGTVTFTASPGGFNSGPINVVNNVATWNPTLPANTYTLTASYSGATVSGNTLQPSGAALPFFVVNLRPTTTTVTSSANPSNFGNAVTFTATIRDPNNSNNPVGAGSAGSVQFFDGTTSLGTVNITGANNGVATLTTSALTVGSHSITAVYSGNSTFFAGSTSPVLTQVVRRAPTTLVATSRLVSEGSAKSQFLVLIGTLTRSDTGAPISGARIVFRDNSGDRICAATTNANGVARCRVLETDDDPIILRFTAQFRQTATLRGASDVGHARAPFGGTFKRR